MSNARKGRKMNWNNSGSGNDKPMLEELTKSPLVNLSYAYELWNELTKLQRSNNNNKIDIDRRREITKTLLDIYSSPKASLVAAQIWDLKATTTEELVNLTGFSSRVIDHTRKNLIRIGLLRSTTEINSPSGKRGPKPWVYALSIADTNDSVEAKLRYEETINQKRRKLKSLQREEVFRTAEDRRLKTEAIERLRDTKVQTLISEFQEQFEKTEKPIPFIDIEQKAKSIDLQGDFMEVALKLEEKGVLTGYYVNGELDPTVLPREIRLFRETNGGWH